MNEKTYELPCLSEAWFVTGTDTEVGKTVVSSALLVAATLRGKDTVGYKPVASGSEWREENCETPMRLLYKRPHQYPSVTKK